MAKILNLDELSMMNVRQIKMFDVIHDVKEMDVDDFIETQKMADKLEKEASNLSVEEQMDITISLINRLVPTLEQEKLRKLSLTKLAAIQLFVRGVDVVGTSEGEPVAEGDTEKK